MAEVPLMALRREWIPENILSAAKRAGLKMPDWYVGRSNGHDTHERTTTLGSIAETVKQALESNEHREVPPKN